jgi:predicted DNA-binding protein (UPF0251 family)
LIVYDEHMDKTSPSLSIHALTQETQEEAFTLAYYLLGDETAALAAVEAAYARLARTGATPGGLRIETLRLVIKHSISRIKSWPRKATYDLLARKLLNLPLESRQVLALVDVLGLDYSQAAEVLGLSKGRVSQALARARRAMSDRLITDQPSQNGAPVSTQP